MRKRTSCDHLEDCWRPGEDSNFGADGVVCLFSLDPPTLGVIVHGVHRGGGCQRGSQREALCPEHLRVMYYGEENSRGEGRVLRVCGRVVVLVGGEE